MKFRRLFMPPWVVDRRTLVQWLAIVVGIAAISYIGPIAALLIK